MATDRDRRSRTCGEPLRVADGDRGCVRYCGGRDQAGAAGDDAESLNDESVVGETTGASSVDLSDRRLAGSADHACTLPAGTVLEPGEQVTIYVGSAGNTETELY